MKLFHRALVLLALPASLAAQQPAPNPAAAANPLTNVFRTRILTFHRNLAQAFDSVPAAKYGYKPTPAQLTIGHIAQHLATDNYFFCNNFGAAKGMPAPTDATTPDSVKARWPKDTLVAKLKASFAFCQVALDQLDDAKLGETITIPGPNGTTRQQTRGAMPLGHVIDMADHYSQMANYMRLNGMLPPTALPRPPARPAGQ